MRAVAMGERVRSGEYRALARRSDRWRRRGKRTGRVTGERRPIRKRQGGLLDRLGDGAGPQGRVHDRKQDRTRARPAPEAGVEAGTGRQLGAPADLPACDASRVRALDALRRADEMKAHAAR